MDKRIHSQPGPSADQQGLPLRGLTPRHVAQALHGLHSRVVSLVYAYHAGQPELVYTFEVAGKVESFRTAVVPEELESISDLYPEAAALEQALGSIGLVFRLPEWE
jgi:hypothetical protein